MTKSRKAALSRRRWLVNQTTHTDAVATYIKLEKRRLAGLDRIIVMLHGGVKQCG